MWPSMPVKMELTDEKLQVDADISFLYFIACDNENFRHHTHIN